MILNTQTATALDLLSGRPDTDRLIKTHFVEASYESKHPMFRVRVFYTPDTVLASLIFEDRPGHWSRLTDRPRTSEHQAALHFFNLNRLHASTDLVTESQDAVIEFLQTVLK